MLTWGRARWDALPDFPGFCEGLGAGLSGSAVQAVREKPAPRSFATSTASPEMLTKMLQIQNGICSVLNTPKMLFGATGARGGSKETHLAEPWLTNFWVAPWQVAG